MTSKQASKDAHYEGIRKAKFIRLTLGEATDQVVDAAKEAGVTVHDLLRSALAEVKGISKLKAVKNGGVRLPREVQELLEKQDRER